MNCYNVLRNSFEHRKNIIKLKKMEKTKYQIIINLVEWWLIPSMYEADLRSDDHQFGYYKKTYQFLCFKIMKIITNNKGEIF